MPRSADIWRAMERNGENVGTGMKTRITELLGTEYPLIQGGMAWIAECRLAAAVSEAGGFGIIGAGGCSGAVRPGADTTVQGHDG